MAVNTRKTQAATAAAAATNAGNADGVLGVTGLVSLFASAIPQNTSGGVLNAYVETFKNLLRDIPTSNGLTIVPVDKARSQLTVSVIAIVQQVGRQAAIFSYVVEATAGEIPAEEYKRHGQPDLQLPRSAGTLYNIGDRLYTTVRNIVATCIDGVDEFVDAGGAQLHKELATDDRPRMQVLLNRAANATSSLLENQPPMNLANLKGLAMDVRAEFPRGNVEDSQGLPIRAAFKIDVNARDLSATSNDPTAQTSTQLSTLAGYVDLQYTGPMTVPGPNGTMLQTTQMYVPKLILTSTTTQHGRIFPELQLLSLACAAALVNRNSWMAALEPAYNDDGVHSLAGMSHELGVAVDTTSTDWNLFNFLQTTTHLDKLNFYIHVAEADDLTWLMAMFRDVAANVPGAYEYVVAKADTLTNGAFSNNFNGGAIVEQENDKVINGYWCDRNGNRRDLREIDQIAFANLVGAADEAKIFAFNDSFNPEKGDLPVRLATRLALLREVLGGNLVFKGYSIPFRITPEFIQALYVSVQSAGVPLNLNQWSEGYQAVSRHNSSLLQASGLNQATLAQGWNTGRGQGGLNMTNNYRGGAQSGRYNR